MHSHNIHPIFDKIASRDEKEKALKQRAKVLWFTGLSGSGKSTVAIALEKKLLQNGFMVQILDGDNIRNGINNNLGFSLDDRKENIRRIAEVSKLFLNCGIICLNCFVSPTKEIRQMAKEIIGEDFLEIYVNTPLEICERRDVKGLYAKARKGEIKNFTGIDSPFEAPENSDYEIDTSDSDLDEIVDSLYHWLQEKIMWHE